MSLSAPPHPIVEAGKRFSFGDHWFMRLLSMAPNRILDSIDRHLKKGMITAYLPGGQKRVFGGHAPGPHAVVTLHTWRALRRLIVGGHTAWARAYIDGDWDSPDLTELFHLFSLNRQSLSQITHGSPFIRFFNYLMHSGRSNSKQGSKNNISFHYDLGNDFYHHWLDPSMTYSSAIFSSADQTLEEAQKAKYRRLLDLLDVQPGQHICEIGCGWGGFAEIAAREKGVYVTGVTLSGEQLAYAQKRMEHNNLTDKVSLSLTDYRDIQGHFDHVVSIEMFEAVGEKFWPVYMDKVKSLLKPNGRAALQIITIDEVLFEKYRRGADFIQTYIFPGGMLPCMSRLQDVVNNCGLKWLKNDPFGLDYAETLHRWKIAFRAAFQSQSLPKRFDGRFERIWHYYLTYCEGGFRGGGLNVHQILLERT